MRELTKSDKEIGTSDARRANSFTSLNALVKTPGTGRAPSRSWGSPCMGWGWTSLSTELRKRDMRIEARVGEILRMVSDSGMGRWGNTFEWKD